jgi:hypothetical protein
MKTPQLTSKDGNMIVDYYPVKTPYGDISEQWVLRAVTFKLHGQVSKKFLNRVEMALDIRERMGYGYTETRDNSNLPQIANPFAGAC